MKRKLVVIAVLVTFAGLWLLTGGLVFYNDRNYGGQSSLTSGDGPPMTIWVDTHTQHLGFPFLFFYYCDRMPYSIRLSVYDHEAKVYRKLLIDEATIEYDDGQVVRLVSPEDGWGKNFEDYVFYNSSSEGVIRHQSLKMEHCFVNAVSRPADFRLRIKARYVREDGSMIGANVEEKYKVSRSFGVMTNWARLGSI